MKNWRDTTGEERGPTPWETLSAYLSFRCTCRRGNSQSLHYCKDSQPQKESSDEEVTVLGAMRQKAGSQIQLGDSI